MFKELIKINKNFLIAFLWISILAIGLLIAYDKTVDETGTLKAQAIYFSHKTHSEKFGIKCLYCHYGAEKSPFSPIPTTYTCMVCHIALGVENEQLDPVNFSFDEEKPLKWNRLYKLPEYTHFNHQRHIIAQIDCSSCHGEAERFDTLAIHTNMTMKWCLDCHRQPEDYIIKAREISGIYTSYNSRDSINIPMVKPKYGEYRSALPKPIFGILPAPKRSGKGPEHCSACHY